MSFHSKAWPLITEPGASLQVFIFANMATMSRMEEYFPKPEEYHPERWLRDDRARLCTRWTEEAGFLSLPFGHGLRACPGKRFAEQGLHLAVISVSTANAFATATVYEP